MVQQGYGEGGGAVLGVNDEGAGRGVLMLIIVVVGGMIVFVEIENIGIVAFVDIADKVVASVA